MARHIELTPDQHERLQEKKLKAGFANENPRFVEGEWCRRQKLNRIEIELQKAEVLLDSLEQSLHANHIAAAMLYLAEEVKHREHLDLPTATQSSFVSGCLCCWHSLWPASP